MIEFLPSALREEIERIGDIAHIGEVHLRSGRMTSLTLGGRTHRLGYTATREVLAEILLRVCGGSLYAYRDTIREGFVPLPGGIRMGIAGRAVTEGGRVVAVTEVTSLCFRIPHHIPGVAKEGLALWREGGCQGGILVIAPPACGKTTYLRDLIASVSTGEGAMRVSVVDSREELCFDEMGELVDVLRGYPRADGLETALRTLSPEVLVCDEIGVDEIASVRDIIHGGVPLFASMHGSSLTGIMKREGVKRMLDSGVFRIAAELTGARGGWNSSIVDLSC